MKLKGAQTTVSAKGLVVIPKKVRERLGIKRGDKLRVSMRGDEIVMSRANKDPIAAGWGMLKGGMRMKELWEEKARELDEEERDLPPPPLQS